jgi:hypothetical protein
MADWRVSGWMDGGMDRWMDTGGWADGWMRWVGGRLHGRTNVLMDVRKIQSRNMLFAMATGVLLGIHLNSQQRAHTLSKRARGSFSLTGMGHCTYRLAHVLHGPF